ncbi:Crp/Fnr family transcriptional regulator [Flavobacterium sp.]|uniref:Crp/Fnr family transcriptional regulator n=1 Tax=Flavobacterium sp. TaxID=239 RepID=UPI00121C2CEB|nr:Crp/Fnr family transcriptional regulator [Flavobacterium sp.]RZJ70562.1 MAG: Crp/Fnr family transcriptional regulator [Flavobacterium sp.]
MNKTDEHFDSLRQVVHQFSGLTDDEIEVSLPFWQKRKIAKGDFFNRQNIVCKDLGIVVSGLFRIFYYDGDSDQEKNIFFFSEKQFIVSFRSFVFQYPCAYYIEALEDSEILFLTYSDLHQLYESHKSWEKFGRILAEHFFNQSQGRTEEFLFLTHEQRYLNLLKQHPNIAQRVPSFHLASFLGIKNQSLSRIKKRIAEKTDGQPR